MKQIEPTGNDEFGILRWRTISISLAANDVNLGYIVMLRAQIFRSFIIRTGIKERNIRARNITI